MVAQSERDISYYRKLFVDPQKPVDSSFIDSSAFLANQLLGTPDPDKPNIPLQDGVFSEFVIDLASRMQNSRHFNERSMAQLHPSGLMPAILAHEASTLRNNNTVAIESSPAETEMEKEAITWIVKNIAGYDPKLADGAITVGGTLANLSALLVARERLSERGWDGRSTVTVLASEMAHYSIQKATNVLGPRGLITVTQIPLEKNGYKTDTAAVKDKIRDLKELEIPVPVMAIVGLAGQTETGLVDNLEELANISNENGIYFHVDGAYGAPFVLSRKKELFTGMDRSDALAVDPHKYMYAPYPGGSIIFKDAMDKKRISALNKDADKYILSELALGKGRIEGSMGGQGAAATLAVIKTLGVDGLRVILNHAIDLTEHAYSILNLPGSPFTTAYIPDLNTLGFYPKNQEERSGSLVESAVKRLEKETGIYLTTEELPLVNEPLDSEGNPVRAKVFRMVITNPYTTKEIVSEGIYSLQEIWRKMLYHVN